MSVSAHPVHEADDVFAEIEERLGFVPPFYREARAYPAVLRGLWQQTRASYLDNPLPALFKEKLAGLLGLHSEALFGMVCHAGALHSLGMTDPEIRELLLMRTSATDVEAALARVASAGKIAPPFEDVHLEADILVLATAVYRGGKLAARSRSALSRLLGPAHYVHLVALISFARTSHDWAPAEPAVSLLGSEARDGEALEQEDMRVGGVLDALSAHVDDTIEQHGARHDLVSELRRSATFAQELVAIVSHDLRNPLHAIMVGTDLALRQVKDNERAISTLARVMNSARRAERLLHDLLDFSAARAGGGIPMHFRRGELGRVAQRVVSELTLAQPGRTFDVRHDGPVEIDCDTDRIAQALSNLLSNALTHGRAGEPIIVDVRMDAAGARLEISNKNANGAIPAELRRTLFEPFKRGGPRAMSRNRSVGLGLYIVDQIVKGHGGRIDVHSDLEATTFAIALPRHQSELSSRDSTSCRT
jgi:sigma-B regulation protein RsbU (phosphoserine phosphatase)